ncbi:Bicarbonate transport system permease protein CmpB [Serratia fonticola]|uniref:Bicarbonate transport system permease protein CmpB n=1 Tax=Serratia fonticola TaxID=47917 RepID=A0A4U9WKU0_SERFO|nr:Bicarbonate transport system permease protein CmpB [Serratia fonticola]
MSLHSVLKAAVPTAVRQSRFTLPRSLKLSTATLLVLLAVWWAVTALQLISPLFLPAPQQVLHQLVVIASPQGFMDATLWQHLAASLGRILVALLAAVVIGVPVGIAMGLSETVRGLLDPLIEIYRPVPPLAYLPLMVIWFGIGETSKILLIYLAIFAPVTLSTVAGVRSVAQVRIRAAQALGANRWQLLRFVVLPSALPGNFDRHPYWPGRRLVYAGGRRTDCRPRAVWDLWCSPLVSFWRPTW